MAAILVAGHWVLPFEVLGILAAGAPLLFALWRADPPRDGAAWARAGRALAPYALLTVALLGARAVPDAAGAGSPIASLPAFPVTHVAIVLLVVSAGLLALGDAPRRRRAARCSARRGRRWC